MSKTFDLLSIGRLAVDLYASEGQIGKPLAAVQQFNVYAGGCPTNVVVGTRRLGLRTGMISRVGTDGLSDGLIDFLNAEGIDTRWVARDAEHRTGLAFLSIVPPDTFPLTYYRSDPADLYLSLDDIASAPLEDTRLLFAAGTNFNADPSRTTTLAAMERAKAAGAKVAFDIDLRRGLWRDLRAFGVAMRSALPHADIVIGTEEEIAAASGSDDITASVARLLAHGAEAVAVKRGGRGADIFTGNGHIHAAKPFTVAVLNTLGAGDAWASGFLYGYLHDWTWEKCARFGNATGAIIVTRLACANDMPTYDETLAFIDSQGGW
ncbi:MAG: 5-dehydro-2-deoxygluconokinase [Chloroflexota bacterium]|nr:5-dehydro-2-deoxygluconokinase [Chloroflexota bacterium]